MKKSATLKGWVSEKIVNGKIIGWLISENTFKPRTAVLLINNTYSKEIYCNQKRTKPEHYQKHINNGFKLFLDEELIEALKLSNEVLLFDKETGQNIAKSIITLSPKQLVELKNNKSSYISDYDLVKKSNFFNPSYYKHSSFALMFSNYDLIEHYLRIGWLEGKNPSAEFDGNKYLSMYSDVKKMGMNPLIHYLRFGAKEGRMVKKKTTWVDFFKSILQYPIKVKKDCRTIMIELQSLRNIK